MRKSFENDQVVLSSLTSGSLPAHSVEEDGKTEESTICHALVHVSIFFTKSGPDSLGITDFSQVDILVVQYKSVNFGAENSLGSYIGDPKWPETEPPWRQPRGKWMVS